MTYEEIRALYEEGRSAFAMRYKQSVKYKKDFHPQVDEVLGKYYSEFGIIFKHIFEYIDLCEEIASGFTLESLHTFQQRYAANPKGVGHEFTLGLKSKNKLRRMRAELTRSMLQHFSKSDLEDLPRLLYACSSGITCGEPCKMCGKPSMFIGKEYSKWCSGRCAIRDGSKTSPEMMAVAVKKRREKFELLKQDKEKFAAYSAKISARSRLRYADPENRKKQSILLKKKILAGEFTPNITNSLTRKAFLIGDDKFRSRFECLFHVYHNIFKLEKCGYEELRIPYIFEEEKHTYLVDFIDNMQRRVYEIKPATMREKPKNVAKELALLEWSMSNDYDYFVVTETQLKEYIAEMLQAGFSHPFIETFLEIYKWK